MQGQVMAEQRKMQTNIYNSTKQSGTVSSTAKTYRSPYIWKKKVSLHLVGVQVSLRISV